MIYRYAAAGAIAVGAMVAPAGAEVLLKSKDGQFSARGELLDFDGQTYRIQSSIGELSLSASMVECEGAECPVVDPLGQEIRIGGNAAILTTMVPPVVDEYAFQEELDLSRVVAEDNRVSLALLTEEEETLATVNLAPTGTGEEFSALLAGEIDMLITDRKAGDGEVDAFLDAGLADVTDPGQETVVGLDGLVFVVSRDNPVPYLSLDDVSGIFAGRITNWSEVGGANLPISVYAPPADSGLSSYFTQAVLDPRFDSLGQGLTQLDSPEAVAGQVAGDPGGIGFTSSAVAANARMLPVAAECGMVTSPTDFKIKSEDYPLTRRLYLYTSGAAMAPRAGALREFLQSDQGQSVLGSTGFVDLAVSRTDLDGQGIRIAMGLTDPTQAAEINNLRQFLGEVIDAERLSATFRFESGSSQLDNKALADIRRVADLIRSPAFRGRELMLVGFTDSFGRSDLNLVLSVRRAEQVFQALQAEAGEIDPQSVRVLGFGAASPVGCNTTEAGRSSNRRVEVWVR